MGKFHQLQKGEHRAYFVLDYGKVLEKKDGEELKVRVIQKKKDHEGMELTEMHLQVKEGALLMEDQKQGRV